MVRATAAVIATSALVMLSTGLSAQTTGIAACDDFLKKYEARVTSKVPVAQKATFQGLLDQMRKITNPKDQSWKTKEEDARIHLSNALGVDSESVYAYTMYGLIYMEGWKSNKNRLDLAKLLLDEGKKRNDKFAPLHKFNPVRLAYVRDWIDQHWALDEHSRRPLEGKSALDVGCGAGLLAEPLARLGAAVTAIDPAEELIAAVANVSASANQLRHGSEILEQLIRDAGLLVVGAEYSLETGTVEVFDGVELG